jgi:hypothetical protein
MGVDDKPVCKKPMTIGELWSVVIHPAFRIGFLDAASGHPLDHDRIMERIFVETPAGALKRLRFSEASEVPLFDGQKADRVALAQYRYEEGRTLFLEYGVRCKAWGRPDYPPAQVRAFLVKRLEQNTKGEN